MSDYVYLVGGISNNSYDEATEWRRYAATRLNGAGIETLDPMRDKSKDLWEDYADNHTVEGFDTADIFTRDLADINRSTILLVNLETVRSVGTPFEMGYGYAHNKLLFIVAPKALHTHPFICEPAQCLTESLDFAIDAIVHHVNLQRRVKPQNTISSLFRRLAQINHR